MKTDNTAESQSDTSPPPSTHADQGVRIATIGRREILRALFADWLTLAAVAFIVVLLVSAIFADVLAPYDPLQQNLFARRVPPFGTASVRGVAQWHLLGTDQLGRDILSRLMYGARVSLAVGILGALVSGIIGVVLGLLAGYFRGRTETIIMRAVDGFMAIPSLLTALFVLFLFGGGFLNLILVFALVRWMVYARITRSLTIQHRESAFVDAARAVGASDGRVIFVHLLPNLMSPLIVMFTLEVAILIIAEASLSFLGFGIQPPSPSWGGMIARGREYIRDAWWLVALPGLAIFLTTLSFNLLASWLRTITDPSQRWRWMI